MEGGGEGEWAEQDHQSKITAYSLVLQLSCRIFFFLRVGGSYLASMLIVIVDDNDDDDDNTAKLRDKPFRKAAEETHSPVTINNNG